MELQFGRGIIFLTERNFDRTYCKTKDLYTKKLLAILYLRSVSRSLGNLLLPLKWSLFRSIQSTDPSIPFQIPKGLAGISHYSILTPFLVLSGQVSPRMIVRSSFLSIDNYVGIRLNDFQ